MREARAYNASILFMVTVPYVVLAGLIGLIWRACRAADRHSAARAALVEQARAETPASI